MMELPVVPEWYADGLCSQTDPEIFFPLKGGNTGAAKKVCRRCPVRAQCLAVALDEPLLEGVWGGTSPRERKDLRKRAA
jgi:WhiB family redox-sensing transcriptional regulator